MAQVCVVVPSCKTPLSHNKRSVRHFMCVRHGGVPRCQAAATRKAIASAREAKIQVAPLSKYNQVAKFMVDTYYLDGDSAALPSGSKRRLEGDQLADLRNRYVSTSARQGIVLVAQMEGAKDIDGCAAISVTPFKPNGRPEMALDNSAFDGRRAAPVLGNLAVSKELRSKGIGRKLIAEAEEICRDEWGFQEIWLGVQAKNRRALSLYKKLGYKTRFRMEEPLFQVKDGKVVESASDNVYMRKSLRAGLVGAIENAPWSSMTAVGIAVAVAAAASGSGTAPSQLLDAVLLNRFGN